MLIIDLVVTILLVKVNVGLIAPAGGGAGAELDLSYIAGFLVVLLAGPGKLSLDRLLGIEGDVAEGTAARGDRVRANLEPVGSGRETETATPRLGEKTKNRATTRLFSELPIRLLPAGGFCRTFSGLRATGYSSGRGSY